MNKLLSIATVALSLTLATEAKGNNDTPPREIIVKKAEDKPKRELRSLFNTPPQAYINYATHSVEIEFYAPLHNGTIHIVNAEGSSVASHTLHTQTQVSLPLPQEQGYYTLIIECDEGEYVGEFEIND